MIIFCMDMQNNAQRRAHRTILVLNGPVCKCYFDVNQTFHLYYSSFYLSIYGEFWDAFHPPLIRFIRSRLSRSHAVCSSFCSFVLWFPMICLLHWTLLRSKIVEMKFSYFIILYAVKQWSDFCCCCCWCFGLGKTPDTLQTINVKCII